MSEKRTTGWQMLLLSLFTAVDESPVVLNGRSGKACRRINDDKAKGIFSYQGAEICTSNKNSLHLMAFR